MHSLLRRENLKKDILNKLSGMETLVGHVEERSTRNWKIRYMNFWRCQSMRTGWQKADKICTDEETVRLKSHISHMRDTLEGNREIPVSLILLPRR